MKILSLLSGNTVTLSNGTNDIKVYKQDIALTGFNGSVASVVKQSNGKILVGGSFTAYNGVAAFGIIRLNADYTVDTTFNTGTGFRNGASIAQIIVQPNGRILVAGSFVTFNQTICSGIVRLTSTGLLDTTFNSNIGTSNANVNAMVLLSSGKIALVGSFQTYNGITQNGIVQLNSDGSIDNTFNTGAGFASQINASTIAVQNDGKYVIGGTFTSYSGQTGNNRIIRLNTDGSKDTSFNVGTGIGNGQVNYITIQPSDGKILVGGSFTLFTGSTQNRIIRLNTDGTKDSTFTIGTGFNSNVTYIAVQPDNKILVGGLFSAYSGGTVPTGLIRLNTNGSKDATFNIGSAGFDNTVSFISVLTGSSNSILLGGFFSSLSTKTTNKIASVTSGGTYQTLGFVSRIDAENYPLNYNSDQSILFGDRSFIDRGFLNTELQANNGLNKSRFANTNNMFQLGGALVNATTIGSSYPLVVNPSNLTLGNYGSTLSFNGNYVFGAAFNANVAATLVQNDGKYLIGGSFGTYGTAGGINATNVSTVANCFIRLNTDGTPDNAFIKGAGFGNGNVVNAMTFQPDNKVIAGGFFNSYMNFTTNMIARINTDGTIDTTFNTGSGFNSSLFAVAVQTGDSKVLAGGQYTTFTGTTQNRLIRLNANGSKDSTFNIGTGFNSLVDSIIVQPDGKILVGGGFTTYTGSTNNRLIRLNSDGSKDTSFVIGSGFNNTVIYLARQTDGKFIAVGSFTTYSGVTANHIVRLNTNGTIDNTFNVGTGFNGAAGVIVAIQPDGKILVGGNFTTFTGSTQNSLIRLNSDGTKDTTFNIGTGFNNLVAAISVLPSGKILVGGNFTTYQGFTVNRVVLLNSDGTMTSQITSDTVLNYTSNLSSKFTARSLVDKGFVTGLTSGSGSTTFSNGLTKTGNNVILGGTLTATTQITNGTNQFKVRGTTGTIELRNTSNGFINIETNGGGIQIADDSSSGVITVDASVGLGQVKLFGNNSQLILGSGATTFGGKGKLAFLGNFFIEDQRSLSTANGIQYAGNYSAHFTPRSLVDKAYVTGLTSTISVPVTGATNGLSVSNKNVILGGTLTSTTNIDGDAAGNFDLHFGVNTPIDEIKMIGGASNFSNWSQLDLSFSSASLLHTVGGTGTARVGLSSSGLVLQGGDTSAIWTEIDMGGNSAGSFKIFDFRSGTNKSGVEYAGDYHVNYTKRSLVDKAFVTGLTSGSGSTTFSNGLTKSGNIVHFGGSLTGNTKVSMGTNTLAFTGTSSAAKVSVSNIDSRFGYQISGSTFLSASSNDISSIQLGQSAFATGTSAIAIGSNAIASSLKGIAIGLNASATGGGSGTNNPIAIGLNASANGDYSISIGYNSSTTTATANGSQIAIGSSAKVQTQLSIAIGAEAGNTSGSDGGVAISIGRQANKGTYAIGGSSIAIGHAAISKGGSDISLGISAGNTAGTSGGNAISIGANSNQGTTNIGASSVAIGVGTSSQGASSTALGNSSITTGLDSIAIGAVTKASAQGAIAMGYGINVGNEMQNSVQDSFALGWNSTTTDFQLTKGTLTTSNATQQTLLSYALATGTTYSVRAIVTARESVSGASRAMFVVKALAYRESSGAVIEGGVPYQIEKVQSTNASSWDATATVSGNNLLISVTGVASTTIHWKVILETTNVH